MHLHRTTQRRDDPAEQAVLPAAKTRPFAVDRKTGDHHADGQNGEEEEHHQLRHRIMADVFLRVLFEEQVPAHLEKHLAPPVLVGQRQHEDLPGVAVADESPVDAAEQTDGKDVGGGEMGETDIAHQKMRCRLAGLGRQRRPDEIAGHRQHHHGERIDPVPQTHRCFVDIDRTDLFTVPFGLQHVLLRKHGVLLSGLLPSSFPVRPGSSRASSRPGRGRRNAACAGSRAARRPWRPACS